MGVAWWGRTQLSLPSWRTCNDSGESQQVPSGSRPVQGSWHQHHLPEAIFEDETRREIIKTEGKDSFGYHNREKLICFGF
jgi:hypothetical protein